MGEVLSIADVKKKSEKIAKDHRAKEVLLYVLGPKAFAAYKDHCKGLAPKKIAEKYDLSLTSVHSIPTRAKTFIQSLSEADRLMKGGANASDIANATFTGAKKANMLYELVNFIQTGEDNLGVKERNALQLKKYEVETSTKRKKSEKFEFIID